ncbi:hypothetical protein BMS3Bbin02_01456 [bacterium BMS3Bbin02]|nr:hypothetical protein BMS3Bbin02_01456 [bacterium BMS3Bbin02]
MEFAVDFDSERLEDPTGGVPTSTGSSGDGLGNHLGERRGIADRTLRDDRSSDSASESFFTEAIKDPRKIVHSISVDDVTCRDGSVRTHSHVEWTFPMVGEPAFGNIELMRRDPEVEEKTTDVMLSLPF